MENNEGFNTGFPGGNMERWSYAITSYLPQAWTTLVKTVDPIIYASLVELLGSNSRFDKMSGDIAPALDQEQNITGFNVKLVYTVPDFAGFSGDVASVQKDQQYIVQKIQTVPNVSWTDKSVMIDTEHGHVVVAFQLPFMGEQQ